MKYFKLIKNLAAHKHMPAHITVTYKKIITQLYGFNGNVCLIHSINYVKETDGSTVGDPILFQKTTIYLFSA